MRFRVLLVLLIGFNKLFAQGMADSSVIVSDIIIIGNKKTKTEIILREILFKKNDTLSVLSFAEKIEQSKHQIYNTALFTEVNFQIAKSGEKSVAAIFTVKERWYIFPIPYFRLVDRNFNDWWVNKNHSLDRVDYGFKFYYNNITGRNDKLTADFITGYSRQLSLRYSLPYINKKLTNGINIGFLHTKQKEVNYATSNDNKQLLIKAVNGFPKTLTRVDATFTNRPNNFLRHNFRVSYTWENVDSFILFVNPSYYGNNLTELAYLDLAYSLNYTKTNYNAYPTKGITATIGGNFRLFNQDNNLIQIGASAMHAKELSKKLFIRNRVGAVLKFPYNGSYISDQIFGYNPYQLRGLEYYVVDGQIGLMHKLTIGYSLFDFKVKSLIKNKYIDKIPFKVYGKVYNDIGYSYKPNANTLLNNTLMHTYGIGIDVITFYDIVFKFEYSFNQLGGNGLFFGLRD